MADTRKLKAVATASSVVIAAAFVVLPLTGGVPVIRVAPVLLAAVAAIVSTARPWRWTDDDWTRLAAWSPSVRLVWIAAAVASVALFWIVLTRFYSGSINAVDFTVYYDRPAYQTLTGHLQYIESAEDAAHSFRSVVAVHAHWIMIPLALLYAVWATPLWLLALSVIAVVAGAVHTLRILQWAGCGGLLASAGAIAFLLNDNTARTLNYGFHAEVLYAWFIPWMLDAGVRRRWGSFALAGAACVAVKEDAFLALFGVAMALLLAARPALKAIEWFHVATPVAAALLNVAIYYRFIVPRFNSTGAPMYASYWMDYGPTAITAMWGMLQHPARVAWSAVTSGFLPRVMAPFLYVLPFIGWRWFVGILPTVVLYGAANNEQMRTFGIYYAIILVPFLTPAAAFGAGRCSRWLIRDPATSQALAASLVLFGALAAGISDAGYSLRPWREETGAVASMVDSLGSQQPILVQSAIYPHAGYAAHVQLLTPDTLRDPRFANAVVLLAPKLNGYPLTRDEIALLVALPPVAAPRSGLVAVRSQGLREED